MEWISWLLFVIICAVAGNALYKSYVKLKIAEQQQQVASLPAQVQAQLMRLEARVNEMREQQRQLRSELEWQAKLLEAVENRERHV